MAEGRRSYPRFRREGEVPRVDLTDDDAAIIRCVYRHRFVSAEDLYRLFANRSADRLSRRLTALFRAHYLDRPIAQIDRFTKGGSQPLIYGLDKEGARFLKEKFGAPIGATDWRALNRRYVRENLDHTVAISHFLIGVEVACRERPNVSYIPFEEILARAPEETRRGPYPGRWSVPVQYSGPRTAVNVAPDAIFGLKMTNSAGQAMSSYVFLEVDRGTMTIAPAESVRESDAFMFRSTVLRKLLSYAETWRQKTSQKLFSIPAARVLFVTTSVARAEAMREAANDLVVRPLKLPASLFAFGQSVSGNALSAVYKNAVGLDAPLLPVG